MRLGGNHVLALSDLWRLVSVGAFPSVAFEAQWTTRDRTMVRGMDKGKHGKNWSIWTQSICENILSYFDAELNSSAFRQG